MSHEKYAIERGAFKGNSLKNFKYTFAAIAAILVLFAVKYWNNSTVGHNVNQNVVDVCTSLKKAFNESTYTAWDYKSCSLVGDASLYLEVKDSTLVGNEKKLNLNDDTITSAQAATFCDLFYKTYPNLKNVVFKVLSKDVAHEIFVYDTTAKVCSRQELDYVNGSSDEKQSSSKTEPDITDNSGVMSAELNIDSVEVETIEKTTVDIQQDAEKLRTETENKN